MTTHSTSLQSVSTAFQLAVVALSLAAACSREAVLTTPPQSTAPPATQISAPTPSATFAFTPTPRPNPSVTPNLGLSGRLVFLGVSHAVPDSQEIYMVEASCIDSQRGCDDWTRLTDNFQSLPEPGYWPELAGSPDGENIAFSYPPANSQNEETRNIFALNINTCLKFPQGCNEQDFTRLTSHSGTDSMPSWSPDGQKIAFVVKGAVSDPDPAPAIFVMQANGAHQTKLLSAPNTAYAFPNWAPDGKRLIFGIQIGVQHARPTLYVASTDGTNVNPLTDVPAGSEQGDFQPRWSPDGEAIVFFSERYSGFEVLSMDKHGSSVRRLTFSGDASHPCWSPDGQRIAYVDRGKLWVMDRQGSHALAITHTGYISTVIWIP